MFYILVIQFKPWSEDYWRNVTEDLIPNKYAAKNGTNEKGREMYKNTKKQERTQKFLLE